jgi:hypothetical protein
MGKSYKEKNITNKFLLLLWNFTHLRYNELRRAMANLKFEIHLLFISEAKVSGASNNSTWS